MLEIPEEIKQRFRIKNNSPETTRHLELTFFQDTVDTLYPSNDLYPADDLFPVDSGQPWLTIGMDRICAETLNLTESLCSSDDIVYGSCEAAEFVVIVADVEDEMIGREFAATLAIGDYKMAYGIYTVSGVERQADRRKRKITAYDRMVKFDVDVADWYRSMFEVQKTYTLKDFRDALCAEIGVPQKETDLVNDDLIISQTINPESLSGRDVLRSICEINGVFGHFDRTGALTYTTLQETGIYPSDTLYPANDLYPTSSWAASETLDHYRTITYEDYVTEAIDRVQIRAEEGDIGTVVGSGTNAYIIEGNFLTYGLSSADLIRLAWSIFDLINGREYRPAKIVTYAMPWIEPGDGIRAITTDTEIMTFVLKRTMKGIQGMSDTIEAKGKQKKEQSFGLQSEIIQLKGKSAVLIKSVEEVSATVSDLEKNTTAQIKVVSDAVTAEVTRASKAEGQLSGRLDVTAEQISLKVSKGDVSSQLSVESGQITLNSNRLVVNSTNFKLDGKGNATFSGSITGGTANLAGGKFMVDAAGNVKLKGATFDGCINTGTMGADVVHCNSIDISLNAVVDGQVQASSVYCGGDASFAEIYIRDSWWQGWSLTEEIKLLHNAVFGG